MTFGPAELELIIYVEWMLIHDSTDDYWSDAAIEHVYSKAKQLNRHCLSDETLYEYVLDLRAELADDIGIPPWSA